MSNLKGKFVRCGKKTTTGKDRFLYAVSGDSASLKAFKKAEGQYYYENAEGVPLWTSLSFHGNDVTLVINKDGKVVADNTVMRQIASLIDQHGSEKGLAIAKLMGLDVNGLDGDKPEEQE